MFQGSYKSQGGHSNTFLCCHPQASDYRSTRKHRYLEYEIMNPYNSQKSLQNSGKDSTVEFHVFEIHTLNVNMRLLKSVPFFQNFMKLIS